MATLPTKRSRQDRSSPSNRAWSCQTTGSWVLRRMWSWPKTALNTSQSRRRRSCWSKDKIRLPKQRKIPKGWHVSHHVTPSGFYISSTKVNYYFIPSVFDSPWRGKFIKWRPFSAARGANLAKRRGASSPFLVCHPSLAYKPCSAILLFVKIFT